MRSNDSMTGARHSQLSTRTLGFALLLLTGAVSVSACADKKESTTSPCPCAVGSVCCSSDVCAKDQASCGQATLALAQEAAGTWTGYFENFSLASGSDALKISIAVSDQITSGQIVLGAGSPPPPPTAGNTSWPPGSGDAGVGGNSDLIEGFVYQARNIRWESRRLKFNVALSDAWQAVCDLYTPITVGDRSFICPAEGWSHVGAVGCFLPSGTQFDCAQVLGACLPGGRCTCDETTCLATAGELNIDVALRGDAGNGSATGVVDTNIRLIRSSR